MQDKLYLTKQNKGSYVLVIKMEQPHQLIAGKLPEQEILPGTYFYIGRAKQSLRGRLARHLRTEKKLFWHIDYLLPKARIEEIWCRLDFFNECQIVSEIMGACVEYCYLIPGFGASDCRCSSHLIYHASKESSLKPLRKKINLGKVRIDDIKKDNF